MKFLLNYLMLPRIQSDFEHQYLTRMNRVAAMFFVAHVPVMVLLAWLNDTGPVLALSLTTATLAGPLLAWKTLKSLRNVSTVMGIASMLMGGLLVHFGQGPVQIEMHFYFFVLLALLAVFANPMVICAAAVTVALHHAVLWYFLPSSVFNYDAPFWVVAVHAAFVVLESVAACFIARSFFDNVIGLEKIVAARTEELEGRNQDMRMLLDAVGQGFFTIDTEGNMSDERSAAVATLLGTTADDRSFVEVLRRFDPKAADWLALGLEDVVADLMPIEVTLDQLPSRCVANGRNLSFEYSPVLEDGIAKALAVVVSDITAEVQREELEAENREMMNMIDRISKDKAGFLEFFREAEQLVECLRNEDRDDLALVKRRVHTLKGNAGIFGLVRLANASHVIEDYIAEHDALPPGPTWTEFFGCWASVRGNLRRITSETGDSVTLTNAQYRRLLDDILQGESRDELATRVAGWKLEPTSVRLKRIADQARALSVRLGKGDITVRQKPANLRLDSETWSPYWSAFVHIIRNAVDHGLESPEDRRLAGKSEAGNLELSTELTDETFTIRVKDDGRGVDWEKVKQTAEKFNLPTETQDDLIAALFHEGLTTASTVTETSGRGVGMSAIRRECEQLGGQITLETETGSGTTLAFSFPVTAMAPQVVQKLEQNGVSNPAAVVTDNSRRTVEGKDA